MHLVAPFSPPPAFFAVPCCRLFPEPLSAKAAGAKFLRNAKTAVSAAARISSNLFWAIQRQIFVVPAVWRLHGSCARSAFAFMTDPCGRRFMRSSMTGSLHWPGNWARGWRQPWRNWSRMLLGKFWSFPFRYIADAWPSAVSTRRDPWRLRRCDGCESAIQNGGWSYRPALWCGNAVRRVKRD